MNRAPYNLGLTLMIPKQYTSECDAFDEEMLLDYHLLQQKKQKIREALSNLYDPNGFSLGMSLRSVGGASIESHLHNHVVPRWSAGTTFLPVLNDTRGLVESLDATYERSTRCSQNCWGLGRRGSKAPST